MTTSALWLNQQNKTLAMRRKSPFSLRATAPLGGELTDLEDALCSSITKSPKGRDSERLGAKSLDGFHRNAQHFKRPCESNERI
jgi:hypothetical protein